MFKWVTFGPFLLKQTFQSHPFFSYNLIWTFICLDVRRWTDAYKSNATENVIIYIFVDKKNKSRLHVKTRQRISLHQTYLLLYVLIISYYDVKQKKIVFFFSFLSFLLTLLISTEYSFKSMSLEIKTPSHLFIIEKYTNFLL